MKPNMYILGDRNLKATIYINPNLNHIKLSSSGSLTIATPMVVDELKIDISSSGAVSLGNVEARSVILEASSSSKGQIKQLSAKSLSAKASSASRVEIAGRVEKSDIKASSSSSVEARKLSAKVASVESSSASRVHIQATESLSAKASSAATINYSGKPKSTTFDKSSAGAIHQVN